MNRETISTSQLTMLVIAFTLGSSLVLAGNSAAMRSGWIAEALGAGEGLLIAWLYTGLYQRFGRRSLVQIAQQVL